MDGAVDVTCGKPHGCWGLAVCVRFDAVGYSEATKSGRTIIGETIAQGTNDAGTVQVAIHTTHLSEAPRPRYATSNELFMQWLDFNPITQLARYGGANERWANGIGFAATVINPKQLLASAAKRLPSAGGVVRQFEQVGDQVYYRVFSGDANVGGWLTAVPPRSSAWAQEALSLPPSNTATMIQEVLVPSGTLLERSRASPMLEWGRLRGGAEQFKLIDEIPLRNFGPGSPLP